MKVRSYTVTFQLQAQVKPIISRLHRGAEDWESTVPNE